MDVFEPVWSARSASVASCSASARNAKRIEEILRDLSLWDKRKTRS